MSIRKLPTQVSVGQTEAATAAALPGALERRGVTDAVHQRRNNRRNQGEVYEHAVHMLYGSNFVLDAPVPLPDLILGGGDLVLDVAAAARVEHNLVDVLHKHDGD
eukprot:CAMPEP_0196751664 /NCGR_PEP_ID=MMETSP1091-20130531/84512_1 /TAXON_ID=302021 /ORGANISM="Rhodomonas sp., Strain CCMP768" /LENGTH=104 /DNA_ID=CAMNT_0042099483 /DNA_START=33 /DNA_END=345 /DNA_ORIENTATION=+